ncbi:MAG: hypothetical protein ACSHYB_17150 [Roseibacillus sp.]
MRLLICFSLLLCSLLPLPSQSLYAIVTVSATNPTDSNARFVITLDPDNAPRSIAQLMMLADPSLKHFRNRGFATLTNNPSGFYRPSDEDGILTPGGVDTYTISVNGSTNAVNVPSNSIATVVRSGGGTVATFRLSGSSTWIHQKDSFDAFDFGISYSSLFNRYMLNVEPDLPYLNESNGSLSSDPFYDNTGSIPVSGGSNPFMVLGERSSGVNSSPGWLIPNEVINPNANSINSNAVFGNHFANASGNVTSLQTYAVAFANEDLTSPNTTASKLLVTGLTGNPDFEGRHTFIGTVFSGNYLNNTIIPTTSVSGSRTLVRNILNGSRNATLKSIRFETIGTPYQPIDDAPTAPQVSLVDSQATIDCTTPSDPRIFTDASLFQVRLVDSSFDLQQWFRAGESSTPSLTSGETGVSFGKTYPRQFFRVNPLVVSYSSWPAQQFLTISKQIQFQGRQIDSTNGPQSLNNFVVTLNSSGVSGSLTGFGGDLNGTHSVLDVEYKATGPYQGELSMESPSLSDTLRLRLYFDAHKAQEYSSGTIIDRYHRLVPGANSLSLEEKNEFGLWQILN